MIWMHQGRWRGKIVVRGRSIYSAVMISSWEQAMRIESEHTSSFLFTSKSIRLLSLWIEYEGSDNDCQRGRDDQYLVVRKKGRVLTSLLGWKVERLRFRIRYWSRGYSDRLDVGIRSLRGCTNRLVKWIYESTQLGGSSEGIRAVRSSESTDRLDLK